MAMFRTGVKILRELSPKKGHCILPIRSISEERHLVLKKSTCPTNSNSPQNCIERSISWVSLSNKKIDESTINSGLPLNTQSPSSPISGKPKVVGLQHNFYRPRGKNPTVKIIKDGYVNCCEGTLPASQGPPFLKEQDRRVRRNSKRAPIDKKDIAMSSNTAHYKPPYTEYKMAVDTRQPKMQGHFLKIYDVNEITVRSDSAAAHPNYVEHRKIGQTPSGRCLRSSKPIPDEVRDTKKMEIPTEQSVYSFVNQQVGSFSKIPTLLEPHAPYRNISTAQGGKLNPEVQEVKKSTQDIKSYVENPVCNMQEFPQEKQINKTNLGYIGRIPSPSYSEMKKAELQNDSKSKSIFPLHKFNPISNDAVLSQKPFGISGKSLKDLCSEGMVRNKFIENDMKSREVSNNPQFPIPNMPLTDVQCFSEDTKSFSDSASAMSKLNTIDKEQKTQPMKKFEDNTYSNPSEAIVREIKANASKLKDSNNANNTLKSEEFSVNGKTRNLKKVQVNRETLAQKEYCKYEAKEQKEYPTKKERHETVYQQKSKFKDWQENATQRGISNNNYDKVEQHNVESYSMNEAYTETGNTHKVNMSKGNDVEAEDVSVKINLPKKQNVSSSSASEEKSMQTVSKNSRDSVLQKHIPTTNVSHFLNIESVYDKHKKFQNPFTEIIAEDTATDGLSNSRLLETENVLPNEKLTKSSDKNTEYFKQNVMNTEPSDKPFYQSHGISKQKVIKWSPAKTNAKFSASSKTQFGSRNFSVLTNNTRINWDKKISGSIPQSCNMGTRHPKLGDLSSKDLKDKVPCGTKKIEKDNCSEKMCKRVCVPGCLIPRHVECENEPATPPPCVKVEAPHPSFSECLKCPPLPPYSKLTECHVEKPKGYYKEYKGETTDACNPPVVVGVCPVRNAFKRVKRTRGEYNVNCDKQPTYPCEVESTFPPSRTKAREGTAPMKCQSNHSISESSLNKITPVQVRFYSSGKLNSPLIKNTNNEADIKVDSQPTTSCVLQNRCIHTPVSLISSTTSQFNPASIIKLTGSAQNLSTCDQCGDSKKYGHDIPLRYKYGDFFPSSSYRKGFMPHPSKNRRSVQKPSCNTSTSTQKTCFLKKNTGPGYCVKNKTHIPYYPTSPYRPTHPCKPSNSDCNPSCIRPSNKSSSSCKQGNSNESCSNPPCQRPHCPTPAIKRPCSCSPCVDSKSLQMRCYSGTSFSGNNSKASPILKRHYSDIVPSLTQNKMKIIPSLLNESNKNILKFPTLERLKQYIHENDPTHTSDSLKQTEVFSNVFNGKEIKFPAYIINNMKCEDEGCNTCKKPKCDRCEKKQCPRPQYKQCPKPPPKRRMCEDLPKCPPKPGLKSNRDCNQKPCCPDNMCKAADFSGATENTQVKMAPGEKVITNSSKEISKTSTLQGLFNSFKSFVSFFISKGGTKDSSTAMLQKSEVESETLEAKLQPQEGRHDIESKPNTTELCNHLSLKSEKSKTNLNGGLFSKTIAAQYYYPLHKGHQEKSFINMNSQKFKTF